MTAFLLLVAALGIAACGQERQHTSRVSHTNDNSSTTRSASVDRTEAVSLAIALAKAQKINLDRYVLHTVDVQTWAKWNNPRWSLLFMSTANPPIPGDFFVIYVDTVTAETTIAGGA
jgi:uncharacterized lipoprotein YmbA